MQPESDWSPKLFPAKGFTEFGTQRFLRTWASLLLALGSMIPASLAGCGPRPVSPQLAAKGFQGRVVTVACPGEPAATVVQRYGQLWASQMGARVKVVRYDAAAGPQADAHADLWIVSPARMPHWADAGQLQPVPEDLIQKDTAYAWQNILPLYRYKLCIWDQKVYALPLLGDALLCFYREDLFQDPAHRAAFKSKYGRDLGTPATWEEFLTIAEYFQNQKRPGIEQPCPSLPPLPERPDDLDTMFYTVAVSFARRAVREDDPNPPPSVQQFSFHYDLESGAVRIDTPGFVHALRFLQQTRAFRPAGPAPEPAVAFQRGEAVLCLASPAWISRFQENATLRGKFSFCRVPGSGRVYDYATGQERTLTAANWVPYLGADGWMMVVPRSNAEPDAAFSLAASLSDPKTSLDIVIEPAWGGGVYRREHLESGVGWHQLGLDRRGTEHLVDLLRETVQHPQITNPVLRLRTPDAREHQRALDAELRAALFDGKDAGRALQAAAANWRLMDEHKDVRTRLTAYRLSLSLGR